MIKIPQLKVELNTETCKPWEKRMLATRIKLLKKEIDRKQEEDWSKLDGSKTELYAMTHAKLDNILKVLEQ